jgi:hypothetical protein
MAQHYWRMKRYRYLEASKWMYLRIAPLDARYSPLSSRRRKLI